MSLFMSIVRPGSVRNIIQQFENNSDSVEEGDTEGQQLSSSSFGEDSMDRSKHADVIYIIRIFHIHLLYC